MLVFVCVLLCVIVCVFTVVLCERESVNTVRHDLKRVGKGSVCAKGIHKHCMLRMTLRPGVMSEFVGKNPLL